MFRNCVAVLNIFSTKLSLTVCERGVNGTFMLRAHEEVDCYTFYSGEFYDVKAFSESLSTLFQKVFNNSAISEISTIYVGVPCEFTKALTKKCRIIFGKVKTISVSDVLELYKHGLDEKDNEYTLANHSASYFVVDNYKSHDPIGKKATSLSARIYYALVSNYFISVIETALKEVKVKTIKYIAQDYAECSYLFSLSQRDQTKLLINVSKTTSSLSIINGNGLLYSSAFASGSANIIAALMEKYDVDYDTGEQLFNKLNLGLKDNDLALYRVSDGRMGDITFPRNEVNQIAKDALDLISENCDNALSKCSLKLPGDIEIAFTGDGICHVKGAIEFISSRIGVFPAIIAPVIPHYNKPQHTSWLSLMNTAIDVAKNKTFFA